MTVLCLTIQIAVRSSRSLSWVRSSSEESLLDWLVVSLLFNVVAVIAGIKGLFHAEKVVIADPIYGRSEHGEFHFSIAAGYFLWATGLNFGVTRGCDSDYYATLCVCSHFISCITTDMFSNRSSLESCVGLYAIGRLWFEDEARICFSRLFIPCVHSCRIVLTVHAVCT